jgi:hypothetical protein
VKGHVRWRITGKINFIPNFTPEQKEVMFRIFDCWVADHRDSLLSCPAGGAVKAVPGGATLSDKIISRDLHFELLGEKNGR